MPLGPGAAGGGALLVTGVPHQAEPHAAGKAAVRFLVADQTPFPVQFKERRLAVRVDVVVGFALVDAAAVDRPGLEVAGVVTCLPVEFVRDLADEVGLGEDLHTGEAIVGRIDIFGRILGLFVGLADGDPVLVIPGLVAVETVEVHRLVDRGHDGAGPAHARDQGLVIVGDDVLLRALGVERHLEIPLGVVVGVGTAVAIVVDVEQGAVLEALVGVERDHGQRTEIQARLDDVLGAAEQAQADKQQGENDTFHIHFLKSSNKLR